MGAGDGSGDQRDRGWKAASVGNAGLLESPGAHSQNGTTTVGAVATPLA
jgi:hypothetical protein